MTKKVWVLGKEYDVHDSADRLKLLNVIDGARDRCAYGDLSGICFVLLGCIPMNEKRTGETQ